MLRTWCHQKDIEEEQEEEIEEKGKGKQLFVQNKLPQSEQLKNNQCCRCC